MKLLLQSFTKVSSTDNYCPDFVNSKTQAENDFFIENNNDSVINKPFNIEELNDAIDSSKCTAPGKDGISNGIIKHFFIKIREYLLMIFNMIWYTSQCPKQWENAILTPILKPGKDLSDLST